MSENTSGSAGSFPMTRWTLVDRAGQEPSEIQQAALNDLLQRYWFALRSHLVYRRNVDSHDADDLVQSFIESQILQRNLLQRADTGRGRFRNLLVSSLNNYVNNQFAARYANKRAPDRAANLGDDDATRAQQTQTADNEFDIAWARTLLADVLGRMERECSATERSDLWQVFHARVLGPILEGAEPLNYETLIEQCGFQSPSQASNALVTAKRMFERLLKTTISEYVLSEDELQSELQDLRTILTRAG
jgi:DNA-directed RNA polymerase specialized sigma24 family protein